VYERGVVLEPEMMVQRREESVAVRQPPKLRI